MLSTVKSSEMGISARKSFAIFVTPPDWWTVATAAVGAYFLSLPQSYQLLISVMAASLISSGMVALKKKAACPWDGFFAIVRRLAELYLLYVTHIVFDALGDHIGMPVDATPLLALVFTGIEFLAFTEDCKILGVPLPKFYTARLRRIQDFIENAGDVVVEQQTTKMSASGVVTGTEQTITTVRTADPEKKVEPLVVPSSDIAKP